jgi:MarR family transcriptional regulator for hemolysin
MGGTYESFGFAHPAKVTAISASTGTKKRGLVLKLAVIARQARINFDQGVERRGLTRAKWTLIAVVSARPGATQRTIAEVLEVREITAGRLIDRLCMEGYLKRQENPSDRRAYCVYPTAAAQAVLQKLDEVAKIHEAELFAGFDDSDLQKLEALLDEVARNISACRSLRAAAK